MSAERFFGYDIASEPSDTTVAFHPTHGPITIGDLREARRRMEVEARAVRIIEAEMRASGELPPGYWLRIP